MTHWLVLDRPPVELPTHPDQSREMWETLVELTGVRQGEWTLVGGQMVFLHALEHSADAPRVSTDLDVLVNARVVTGAVRSFVEAIEERGFALVGLSPEGIGHRYQRAGVSVDVLAPDGLGPRADLTTTPPGRTVEVPGGTQALVRTELVPVRVGDSEGLVPRPSLLGAIIAKAEAVRVDDAPDAQRGDLAFLLSLVADPLEMARELGPKDRKRLGTRTEMSDRDHPVWRSISPEAASRAQAAFRLLTAIGR
jgi:hypothetical protein